MITGSLKTGIVVGLVILAVVFASIRIHIWWHQETAKGHHVSFSPVTAWGFYSSQGETMVAYPPGQPDYNTVFDTYQYGPINDEHDHLACEDRPPDCSHP